MIRFRQPSARTANVLNALAVSMSEWRHGYDLCRETGLKAGSMYPILMRLADRGFLETKWESETTQGRPPRHLYRITGAGVKYLAELATSVSETKIPLLEPQTGKI